MTVTQQFGPCVRNPPVSTCYRSPSVPALQQLVINLLAVQEESLDSWRAPAAWARGLSSSAVAGSGWQLLADAPWFLPREKQTCDSGAIAVPGKELLCSLKAGCSAAGNSACKALPGTPEVLRGTHPPQRDSCIGNPHRLWGLPTQCVPKGTKVRCLNQEV